MKDNEKSLKTHYASENLSDRILTAINESGRHISSYEDTAALDEFHMRGRTATRELARLAHLNPGGSVLDLGCGLGGPGRVLAAEFGCRVTGIDLMQEYVDAAQMLSKMVGLSDRTAYRQGNMLALPFEDACFDVVWSQHTFMNIEDKSELFREIRRVLRSDGCLAVNEILLGAKQPIRYPVQWATDESISFLMSETQFKALLEQSGFSIVHWEDVSEQCSTWFQGIIEKMKKRRPGGPPPLGLNLVIGSSAAEKAVNTARNLEQDRIRVVYGVMKSKAPSAV